MKALRAVNLTKGTILVEQGEVADGVIGRGVGLIGRSGLPAGGGLLLRPCKSVHTFFMRFPIDVVFVNGDNRVVHVVERMGPNRISKFLPVARCVLELPAGTVRATTTQVGDKVALTHL